MRTRVRACFTLRRIQLDQTFAYGMRSGESLMAADALEKVRAYEMIVIAGAHPRYDLILERKSARLASKVMLLLLLIY